MNCNNKSFANRIFGSYSKNPLSLLAAPGKLMVFLAGSQLSFSPGNMNSKLRLSDRYYFCKKFQLDENELFFVFKRGKGIKRKRRSRAMFKSTKMRHRSDTMINYSMPTLTEKESCSKENEHWGKKTKAAEKLE